MKPDRPHGRKGRDLPEHAPGDRRFQLLAEAITDYGVFLLGPDGTVETWNPGARLLKGYEASEIVGKSFAVFYPKDDQKAGKPQRLLRVAEAEGQVSDEGWRVRKDGSMFFALVVITALRDEGGKLIGFGKVVRDLTERRVVEERLRRSEERLRLMIEAVKDYAIFMLDPHGRIESWNPGAQRLKQYTAEEIVGRHFSIFYPREAVASGWPEHELKVASETGRFEDEGWRVRKDGSRFWASVVISAIRAPTGELLGFTKVTRDLTEWRRREEDLRKTADELRKSNAELEEYAAFVSHDLQEPLRKMASFAELVDRRYRDKLDEGGRRYLAFIVDGAERMRRLIVDVLDYSRIGHGSPRFEAVELDDVASEVLRDLELPLRESGAALELSPLPRVRGNAALLGRLLQNLLSNALKFRDPSRPLRVSVRATREGGFGVLSVKDNGIGFDPALGETILRPFARLHSKERYAGTGVGLATVKKIAELHGGRVWSEGRPGAGAEFFVSLPLEVA